MAYSNREPNRKIIRFSFSQAHNIRERTHAPIEYDVRLLAACCTECMHPHWLHRIHLVQLDFLNRTLRSVVGADFFSFIFCLLPFLFLQLPSNSVCVLFSSPLSFSFQFQFFTHISYFSSRWLSFSPSPKLVGCWHSIAQRFVSLLMHPCSLVASLLPNFVCVYKERRSHGFASFSLFLDHNLFYIVFATAFFLVFNQILSHRFTLAKVSTSFQQFLLCFISFPVHFATALPSIAPIHWVKMIIFIKLKILLKGQRLNERIRWKKRRKYRPCMCVCVSVRLACASYQ